MILRFCVVLLVLFACLLSEVPPAAAHAILVASKPGANSVVAGPNITIELRFNVRVDATRSRLTLVATGTTEKPLALKIENQSAAETLTTPALGLKPGTYSIRWQVLASDGHITRGEVPFTVSGS